MIGNMVDAGRERQRLARGSHLVSKFYLGHFADEDGMLTTVRLPGDRRFRQSVERASVENDFYTITTFGGQESDVAERAFGEIEGPAAAAWRQLAAGVWPLPPTEREAVAAWIALHLLRGSGSRAMLSDMGTAVLQLKIAVGGRARLRDTLRELGEPYDDESVTREWISLFEDPLMVEANANHHLEQIARMLPRVTQSLLDRFWVLTSFTEGVLATSDHPAYVKPNPDHAAVGLGTGIQNAHEVHVPVTRRQSLGMALRAALPRELSTAGDRHQPGIPDVALYCNSCTVSSARRALFHHPEDDPLAGFDLPQPRNRELGGMNPWQFMPDADRQVLLEAGLRSPDTKERYSG